MIFLFGAALVNNVEVIFVVDCDIMRSLPRELTWKLREVMSHLVLILTAADGDRFFLRGLSADIRMEQAGCSPSTTDRERGRRSGGDEFTPINPFA